MSASSLFVVGNSLRLRRFHARPGPRPTQLPDPVYRHGRAERRSSADRAGRTCCGAGASRVRPVICARADRLLSACRHRGGTLSRSSFRSPCAVRWRLHPASRRGGRSCDHVPHHPQPQLPPPAVAVRSPIARQVLLLSARPERPRSRSAACYSRARTLTLARSRRRRAPAPGPVRDLLDAATLLSATAAWSPSRRPSPHPALPDLRRRCGSASGAGGFLRRPCAA